jgi:arylsulfatase A-like enzyme
LYEGGFRVPAIVRWKGRIAPALTERVTGFEDWLPTLLELAGMKEATPAGLDGISFAPTLRGQTQGDRPFLYREFPGYGGQQSVRVGDWKGIRQKLNPKGKKGVVDSLELYNLKEDIAETRDLAVQHPEIVAKLERLLRDQHTPSKEFPFPALDTLVR